MIRKRSDGVVLEAGEVVEVGPVRDREHAAAGLEAARLLRDRVGGADDGVRLPRDELRHLRLALLLHPDERALRAAVRVGDERVAEVGDPAGAGRALHRGADEVDGGRRRGREHDVDPLAPRDPDRRRDRGHVPGHVLVRHERAAERQPALRRDAREALLAVQLLGGLPPLRPEVARAVHPGLRRQRQVGVGVHPLRVVGREHVRLDPEPGEVRGELQRALDARAARRREVEGDEQELHRRSILPIETPDGPPDAPARRTRRAGPARGRGRRAARLSGRPAARALDGGRARRRLDARARRAARRLRDGAGRRPLRRRRAAVGRGRARGADAPDDVRARRADEGARPSRRPTRCRRSSASRFPAPPWSSSASTRTG